MYEKFNFRIKMSSAVRVLFSCFERIHVAE